MRKSDCERNQERNALSHENALLRSGGAFVGMRRAASAAHGPVPAPGTRGDLLQGAQSCFMSRPGYGVGGSGLTTATWLAGGGVTFTVTPKSNSSWVVSMVIWVAVASMPSGTLRVTA